MKMVPGWTSRHHSTWVLGEQGQRGLRVLKRALRGHCLRLQLPPPHVHTHLHARTHLHTPNVMHSYVCTPLTRVHPHPCAHTCAHSLPLGPAAPVLGHSLYE